MHLSCVSLRVRSPENLRRFYVERLGMAVLETAPSVVLGFGGGDAAIELCQADADRTYQHRRTDRYWKIGITLPDVDVAQAQLVQAGVTVSEPRQFGDIGYMCHLQDPEGFEIELLQHSFGACRAQGDGDPAKPLGGGARVGQVTLRVADLDAALGFYRDRLGMTLLSIQPVSDYGFTLYFLAFTDERPPQDDLKAVGNREWLWQRAYTTLELQHFPGASTGAASAFTLADDGEPGFAGIAIAGAGDHAGGLVD